MSTRLTKKQKKAATFRGKKKEDREIPQDVPLMDDPTVDDGFGEVEIPPPRRSNEKPAADTSKKRKREDDPAEQEKHPNKKVHLDNGRQEESSRPKHKKQSAAPRYILFVGNLSYKTTTEAIVEHFSACDPPPTIRRLTTRPVGSNMAAKKPERSRGCAFLEFSKASGLQNALRLHHSELDGRKINVELSAGGGGKNEARVKKLKEKNAKLDKHRLGCPAADDKEPEAKPQNPGKVRYSSTSGTKTTPQHKPTWSIPKDGEIAGRGGQKHRRAYKQVGGRPSGKDRKRADSWTMSGANAIPVG